MKPAKYISEMRDEVANDSRNDLHNTYSVKNHVPHFVPSYKNLYLNQKSINKGLLIALGVSIVFNIGTYIGSDVRVNMMKNQVKSLQSQVDTGLTMASNYADYTDKLETDLASCSAKLPKKKVSTGKVSFYSKDGCIGCGENQRMSNGQIFDEMAMTLAHNQIPLNTSVQVKNLDNGKVVTATVTDRGGFNKYNRIADLSKGLFEALNAKTDKSNIEISWY